MRNRLRCRAAFVAGALVAAASCTSTFPTQAAPLAIRVDNHTRATRCAEEDNVSLMLNAPGRRIARFRVEALPPAYLGEIGADNTAPDFSACDFDGGAHPTDPVFHFEERHVVLHDGPQWRVAGIVLPTFWRPDRVPVTLGRRTENGLHLLQIFAKDPAGGRPREVLVLYPADGYWRIKPLPEARFGDGVYGSSFLVGPVAMGARPWVDIAAIAVTVAPLALRLRFADGSTAHVRVGETSTARTSLDVRLGKSRRRAADAPFAVLRSMYVAPDNADVSEVQWRHAETPAGMPAIVTRALPDVATLQAVDVRFGRARVSRHNTSAPDIRFSGFDDR